MPVRIPAILASLLFCGAAFGQVQAELLPAAVETAVNASGYPMNRFYHDQRMQSIYLASELNAAGLTAGAQITGWHLKVANVPTLAVENFRIRMKHTTATAVPAGWETTGWTEHAGPPGGPYVAPTVPPALLVPATFTSGQYYQFTFHTNFMWDGTSNLFVEFTSDANSYTGSGTNGGVYMRAAGAVRTRFYYSDSGSAWPFDLMSSLNTSTNVPSTRLTYIPGGPNVLTSVTTLNLGNAAAGTAGNPANYTITGLLLTANTNLTAPAGVEISFTQAAGYAGTLQVAQFPSYGPITVYARIADTAAAGPITGNISHDSPGAATKTIAVSGNVVSLLASVPTLSLGFATIGVAGPPVSYTLDGLGLIGPTNITVPPGVEIADNAGGPWGPTLTIPTTPSFSQQVFLRLDGVQIGNYAGNVTATSGPATSLVAVNGDVFPPDNLHVQRQGPNTQLLVDNNSQGGAKGLLLLEFLLNTIQTGWDVTAVTFSASGTADEQQGLSFLGLYEDSQVAGNGGVFDGPAIDTLAATSVGVNFNGPNGDYTANLTNVAFPPNTTRRFFLVCRLAGAAVVGETIKAEVTGLTATTAGTGFVTGVPTGHPVDPFMINTAEMTMQLAGPVVFNVVDNNARGANDNGIVVCNLRLTPKNDGWTVNSLTFNQTGTMDGQADVDFLALYQDDGDGIWEGPAVDTLATSVAGVNFSAPNGDFVAGLTGAAGQFGVNQVKRFFLVAKLAGTASSGETLRVRVSSVSENSPSAGVMVGAPTGSTSAIMIDQPTLTVNAGSANPNVVTREKTASGFAESIGHVRLSARNSAFTVAGMTLHTAGTGDWLNDLDPATGLQVFRDNGNMSFDVADILLFSGGGATPVVNCTFTTSQNIATNSDLDLWVVLNVLPAAGGSPYDTFWTSIEAAADVNSLTPGGTVKIGTLPPVSGTLRVVDFRVDDFTPTVGLFAGGASIKIEGSGFATPVVVTIGGIPCTGVATVSADGTLIGGLQVPAGTGSNLPIMLTTNNLPAKQLTMTFRYSAVLPVADGGTVKPATNGCAAAAGSGAMLVLPALAVLGLRRRRK